MARNHHLQILTHVNSSIYSSQGTREGKSMRCKFIFNAVKTHYLLSNSNI